MRPLSIYVHVPFCASRCGYCDFNTYTASDLGGQVQRDAFDQVLISEVRLAALELGADRRAVDSVFFGGGTPTLLSGAALVGVLKAIAAEFGLVAGAEVTTEANPDSVDQAKLDQLVAGGFTRISYGVQSVAPNVLKTLDRTHTAGAARTAIQLARSAGFEHISADLIIATPGESDEDLRASVDLVTSAGVDHVSAYTLIVEPNTPLARQVATGAVPSPDDETAAHRYGLVDELLSARGFNWYEVSNWAKPGGQCRHNGHYWRNDDWLGVGPGAHSHRSGVRWWNVRHPRSYAVLVAAGELPVDQREVLTAQQVHLETVMLGLRTAAGLELSTTGALDPLAINKLVSDGLLDNGARAEGWLRVTPRGRLFVDAVTRDLTS